MKYMALTSIKALRVSHSPLLRFAPLRFHLYLVRALRTLCWNMATLDLEYIPRYNVFLASAASKPIVAVLLSFNVVIYLVVTSAIQFACTSPQLKPRSVLLESRQ